MTDVNKTAPFNNQQSSSGQRVGADGHSDASRAGHRGEATAPAAESADKGAKTKPKADTKPKAEGGEKRGRVSQYSGMLLKATVETNTRREGSHGHKSLGIIMAAGKEGILYEDYLKKGGRLNDLVWDINKDNVEAMKTKA